MVCVRINSGVSLALKFTIDTLGTFLRDSVI